MKKMILFITLAVVIIGFGIFFGVGAYQMNKITTMTFKDMLLFTTKNNEKAVITVGIIKNGDTSYVLYGGNGVTLPQATHIYEIGSITKTFTAALLFKAADEGKINIDDAINKYLNLPKKEYYPAIRHIITHTSGYNRLYFESQMILNFFNRRNLHYSISKEQLIYRVGKINLKNRTYDFKYSNFGLSIIGAVLSEVYQEDFTKIMNVYIKEELGLENTIISNGSGDLGNYWEWSENDAYLPAGGLTSAIEDMLKYAQLQMNNVPEYLSNMHNIFTEINATSSRNANMNIRMDSIGATWIIDSKNNIIWHNGGTGDYNSYLGFDEKRQIAVVILSNLPPNYRIPATVMGAKLLKDLQSE